MEKSRLAALIAIVVLGLAIFYVILQLPLSGLIKFVLVIVEMIGISQIFIRYYGQQSEMGLVLLRSKSGVDLIDRIAANRDNLFNFLADTGSAMSYGLLGLVFMKQKPSVQNLILGFFLLSIVIFLIGPFAFVFLSSLLKLAPIQNSVSSMAGGSNSYTGIIFIGVLLLLGGLFFFVLFGIAYYGIVVFSAVVSTLFYSSNAIAKTAPGGTFLLPGINLPFFEGILALAVILIVHEGAHAVLTRVAKTKLLSSGIVLFGIIPIGAFVEPDEAELAKLSVEKQTRIYVAGSTSNLMNAIIFFIPFLLMTFLFNSLGSVPVGILGFALRFVYISLGLIFSLNFIIGTVNLLPIPLFDGYRIVEVNLDNKNIVKYLAYATMFFFILNFLPLLFH